MRSIRTSEHQGSTGVQLGISEGAALVLLAEVECDVAVDHDLVALGPEDVARGDDDLLAPSPGTTHAPHTMPQPWSMRLCRRCFSRKVPLVLREVVGTDELAREEPRALQAHGSSQRAVRHSPRSRPVVGQEFFLVMLCMVVSIVGAPFELDS